MSKSNVTILRSFEALNCDFSHIPAERGIIKIKYAGSKYFDKIEQICKDLMKNSFIRLSY